MVQNMFGHFKMFAQFGAPVPPKFDFAFMKTIIYGKLGIKC